MSIPDYFSFQIPAIYTSISFVASSGDNVKITLLLLPTEKKVSCQLEKATELSVTIFMSYTKRTFKTHTGKIMKSFNVIFSILIFFPC